MFYGVVRLLWFDKTVGQFGDVAKSDFHGNCVLQLSHVISRSSTANHSLSPAANQSSAVIVSAGTDGRICVWDVTAVVMGLCRRLHESENEIGSALNCVAEDDKSFSSLTETVCTDVAGQHAGDSLQNTEAGDTQAAFNSTVGCLKLTEGTERLALIHGSLDDIGSYACGTQAVFHSSSDTAGSCERNKAGERLECELSPCCVVTAHQSGINSLAIRQRLAGLLRFHLVTLKFLTMYYTLCCVCYTPVHGGL